MRPLSFALVVAALHRAVASGLWYLGFARGMASFNDSSAATQANLIWALSGILDFPVLALQSIRGQLRYGAMPRGEMALLQAPISWKLVWSAAVGVLVALSLHYYRENVRSKRSGASKL
jgi:hypothetical protein